MPCNGQYAKSCIRTYNNATQAVTATPTIINIEGTPVVKSGCSLGLNVSSIRVNKSGLYHVTADVTFTPTAAGIATIQLYMDGVALPCAIVQETVVAGNTYTKHVETDLCLAVCPVNKHLIDLRVGGVAGSVTHVCVGALKLA